MAEKRKYVRFLAGPNAYAALGSSFTKIGKIRDISMGGLAFEYFSGTEDSNRHDTTVTIFLTVNNFYLEKLPCLMVCDHEKWDSNASNMLSTSYHVKRCSVQFMTISDDQRHQLEYFLNNFTQGIVPSENSMEEVN